MGDDAAPENAARLKRSKVDRDAAVLQPDAEASDAGEETDIRGVIVLVESTV